VKTLRGTASRVSRSAGSQYLMTCYVEDQTVEIAMPHVPIIEEGHSVIVAGDLKFGTLKVMAYRNLSNNTSGHWNYDFGMFVAVLVGIASMSLSCLISLYLCFVPLIGVGLLVWFAYEKIRIYQAYTAMMSEPSTGG